MFVEDGTSLEEMDFQIIQSTSELPNIYGPSDRKMFYCIDEAAFYLWDRTEWVKQAQASGGGSLTENLNVTMSVGGISSGTTYEDGTPIEDILKDMLNPVEYPTLTNPNATLSAEGNTLLEDGSNITTTMTITFNRGSISPAYGTSGYRAGNATGYSLNGTSSNNNTFSVNVNSINKTFNGSASYSAGEQPKDSEGNNYSSPLPAGTVNTNTINYEFVNALWANTASASTIAKLDLVSKSAKQAIFNFPACSASNPETFDVPDSWTISAIEVKNDLTGLYDNCSTEFNSSAVSHSNASGASVSYTRYSCNLGYDMGARTIRIKWL